MGEVKKAKQLQNFSPTLSIIIDDSNEMAWVSACGDKNSIRFVSESRFLGEVKKSLGLHKGQGIFSLGASSLSHSNARKALQLFSSKQYEPLRDIYKNA
tara:strand:+ start:697 stop:993 length:297 start_codon:yes stop_codon:yes gene_type:complete